MKGKKRKPGYFMIACQENEEGLRIGNPQAS
jgi:hypothetical protein